MPERFAIYYAPATTSPLWQQAIRWLGRDPAAGSVPRDGIEGIAGDELAALTPSASRYGFHATLKAPMTLADGCTRSGLEAELQAFCLRNAQVSLGRLELRLLDGFLALMPVEQSQDVTDLGARIVAEFDAYRAPMSSAERERRIGTHLTAYQIGLLDHFGYPYVMDEFRFHMTLTDRLSEPVQEQVMKAAARWFGPVLGEPVTLDRLSLYHEPEAGAPFVRVNDFPLSREVKI